MGASSPVRRLAAIVFALSTFLLAGAAWAAPGDAAATRSLGSALDEDYPGNLGNAKRKLNDALSMCLKKGCSSSVKGRVYVGLGMVASQLGQQDEAKKNFKNAIQADSKARLPASGVTPSIRTAWEEVAGGDGGGDSGGGDKSTTEEPKAAPSAAPEPEGDGKAIPKWFRLAKEAFDADQAGRLEECIEKDKASLKLQEEPRTRLHLASCESRAGKLVDGLKDAQKALETGIQRRDVGLMKVARQRVKELIERIPHVTFVPPSGVSDLSVKFDDRPVPEESLTKKFSVDPGKHSVTAEGTVNGFPSEFSQEYDVKERELVKVQITLKPPASEVVTQGQIKCMLQAKTQEEVEKCLPQNAKNIVVRLGTDISGYTDTTAVGVFSPGWNASVTSPTAGWNVGGNFIVDAVSAASPDIVATASPPFREYRYAGGLSGGYKPGLYGVQAHTNYSNEPDYVSRTVGLSATADLKDKLITPQIGYSHSWDSIGRGVKYDKATGEFQRNYLDAFDPLKGYLLTHTFEAGVTFVMSPTSILVVGLTGQFERGDQSKPYRYVPMFDPENVGPFVPSGATIDLVNRVRLPVRPIEQLPTSRDRWAVGARYNKRIGNATLRLDERLYFDTWGTKASSTDSRYLVDLSKHLRVWPHVRLHVQSSASSFYQRTYGAITCGANDPAAECAGQGTGTVVVPLYRTGDRELAPLFTLTAGGGTRIGLGAQEGDVKYGITITGDVMYTRFFKTLFVTQRTAVYGSVAFDVEF